MSGSAAKISLKSYDDLFSTEETQEETGREKVQMISLSELHPFTNHPFKVNDDDAMLNTADSVKQYGVLVPAIARPRQEGRYELVAGHRRHRRCRPLTAVSSQIDTSNEPYIQTGYGDSVLSTHVSMLNLADILK